MNRILAIFVTVRLLIQQVHHLVPHHHHLVEPGSATTQVLHLHNHEHLGELVLGELCDHHDDSQHEDYGAEPATALKRVGFAQLAILNDYSEIEFNVLLWSGFEVIPWEPRQIANAPPGASRSRAPPVS